MATKSKTPAAKLRAARRRVRELEAAMERMRQCWRTADLALDSWYSTSPKFRESRNALQEIEVLYQELCGARL